MVFWLEQLIVRQSVHTIAKICYQLKINLCQRFIAGSSTSSKGTETKVFTLNSSNQVLLNWVAGSKTVSIVYFVANYIGPAEGFYVGFTENYAALEKEFSGNVQRKAVSLFSICFDVLTLRT